MEGNFQGFPETPFKMAQNNNIITYSGTVSLLHTRAHRIPCDYYITSYNENNMDDETPPGNSGQLS